ncbi:HEPN domain-containing protein [Niabella aurantiaca]|uniref:HEPN domain-containing protein n=1 Tax=Niabella aurantiaca TaxID=379900 RepID=UPI00037D6488|nr:HEPN domain-containing protein [Niabella aurantiaca]
MKNDTEPGAQPLNYSGKARFPGWGAAEKRYLLKQLIVKEAERGFAHYLFDLLPDVERMFCPQQLPGNESQHVPLIPSKEQIISWISCLCSPEFVFELKCDPEQHFLDLLIVLKPQETRGFRELGAYIHTATYSDWDIQFTLCPCAQLRQQRKQGNLFYVMNCIKDKLVYSREGAVFDLSDGGNMQDRLLRAKKVFEIGYQRGQGIFENFYWLQKKGANELACFMLHQAAELTLRGFAAAFSGIQLRQHSIKQLLCHCARIHKRLDTVFQTPTEFEMLDILEASYTGARYSNDFAVPDHALTALGEKVRIILVAAEEIARQLLNDYLSRVSTGL